MARWPNTADWPQLEMLNDGNKFTPGTPMTYEILNKIVLALIHIFTR